MLGAVLTNGLIVGAILETPFNSLLQDNQFQPWRILMYSQMYAPISVNPKVGFGHLVMLPLVSLPNDV